MSGSVGWGSKVVNGQLVPQAPSSAFYPTVFSAEYTGPGYWPKQGTYQVPPVVPNPAYASGMSPNAVNGGPAPSGVTAGGNGVNPFHPTKGSIVFGFGALVAGLFMLRYIHYGE